MRGSHSAHDRWHVAVVVENVPLGVDPRLRKQVDELLGAGYRVSVITMRDDANTAHRSRPGLTLLEHPAPKEAAGLLGYLREYTGAFSWAALYLTRLRMRGRIDVLQLCQPPDIYFPLAWVLRWSGTRIVVDQRDLMPEVFRARYVRPSRLVLSSLHFLERRTQKASHETLTVNHYLERRLIGAGARPDRLGVVWNGPPLSRTQRSPQAAELVSGGSLVLWMGKMGRQDRVELVLEVVDLLVNDRGRRDCCFALLGDGECLEELQQEVVRRGLASWVRFTGWLEQEEVYRFLGSAELGLDTSLQEEVSPVKAIEYMAQGLAFACFDLPETRELAHGAALLVEPGNVEAMADSVIRLLDDPALRRRLGEVGRQRVVESLAWEHQARTYLAACGPQPTPVDLGDDGHPEPGVR